MNKKFELKFPWWCLFLAYSLSFLIIIVSIFFIIIRGIEFGDLKTEKWLTSIVTGFFSSIFVTQPMKIICLSIFFICFCRNSIDEKEEVDINQFEIDQDDLRIIENSLFISRSSKRVNRLDKNEINIAREERIKDIQMWSIIQELFISSILLILICLITFSNHQQNDYFQVQHLQNYFLNTRQPDCDYTQVFKS
jgi:hypothetical protein